MHSGCSPTAVLVKDKGTGTLAPVILKRCARKVLERYASQHKTFPPGTWEEPGVQDPGDPAGPNVILQCEVEHGADGSPCCLLVHHGRHQRKKPWRTQGA